MSHTGSSREAGKEGGWGGQKGRMDPEGPGRTGEGVWVGPSSKGVAWSDLGFRKVTLHKR